MNITCKNKVMTFINIYQLLEDHNFDACYTSSLSRYCTYCANQLFAISKANDDISRRCERMTNNKDIEASGGEYICNLYAQRRLEDIVDIDRVIK